jgi:hypothetical protein
LDCTSVAHSASQVVCIVQPFDWRIYISPALIAISAFIAWMAIRNAQRIARQRATLDLIEKAESNDYYREIAATFSELRQAGGFSHLHDPKDDATKQARRHIADYLNHYELISVGILEKFLDETVYRAWMEGAFLRDWNAAAKFIQRERWKRNEDGTWYYYSHHFEHYQVVAESWSREIICLDKLYSGPPTEAEAGGPGDDPLPVDEGEINVSPAEHWEHSAKPEE